MDKEITMPLGVVVEKRKSDHKWIDWVWKPVAVIPGAGPQDEWLEVGSGDNWTHFLVGSLPLTLHRTETESYVMNLSDKQPSIYTILRENDDDEDGTRPYLAHLVTASPFEAQDFEDTGEDIIERIPMPDSLIAWVQDFVGAHHVDEPFVKRKRRDIRDEPEKFGKEPIFGQSRQSSEKGPENDQ
ncbi:MAG: DUF3305 domain-containing protein [Rhizobiales bacterium]|nr:DUF3305 domain-containing protein [Hyphomicrobiales bacterium]